MFLKKSFIFNAFAHESITSEALANVPFVVGFCEAKKNRPCLSGLQASPVSPAIQAPTLSGYFWITGNASPGRSVRCTLHRLTGAYNLKQRLPIHPSCCANLLVSYASQFFNVAVFSTLPTFQHSALLAPSRVAIRISPCNG